MERSQGFISFPLLHFIPLCFISFPLLHFIPDKKWHQRKNCIRREIASDKKCIRWEMASDEKLHQMRNCMPDTFQTFLNKIYSMNSLGFVLHINSYFFTHLPCTEARSFFLDSFFLAWQIHISFLVYADEDGNRDDEGDAEDEEDEEDSTFNAISICNPFILASCWRWRIIASIIISSSCCCSNRSFCSWSICILLRLAITASSIDVLLEEEGLPPTAAAAATAASNAAAAWWSDDDEDDDGKYLCRRAWEMISSRLRYWCCCSGSWGRPPPPIPIPPWRMNSCGLNLNAVGNAASIRDVRCCNDCCKSTVDGGGKSEG